MGLDTVWTLVLVALYGVAILNCARVLGDRLTTGATISWIAINLALPFVGVPVYLLLGNYRIRGYVKRHRARVKELAEKEESSATPLLPPQPQPPARELIPHAIRDNVETFGTIFSTFGTEFDPQWATADLLIDGESTFEAIFTAIAGARRYILVQYYILRSDRLGMELKRLLVEKARAGLPVYLLYDDMGSFWLSSQYIRDLKQAGVKVERFLAMASFKRFFQINFRNHRKMVIVDGEQAFTGGLNVGEEYAARRTKKNRTLLRYWRDTHISVRGDVVSRFEDVFLEDWYFATSQLVRLAPRDPTPALNPLPPNSIAQVIPTAPTDDTLISVLYLMHLFNSAKKRLWIATPYFVPDAIMVKTLELAALRGVDVRLILPRISDNRFVHWVSLSYAEQMQARGVIVLLYEAGFMHQKAILVDENLASVGTMNLDNRAVYFNFETMVLIHSEPFNRKVEAMLKRDFLACRFLKQDKNRIIRRLKQWRAAFARLFAPLL